ncbi:unnamed protein product, partial [Ectocarpus sp. 12 AP-2014]
PSTLRLFAPSSLSTTNTGSTMARNTSLDQRKPFMSATINTTRCVYPAASLYRLNVSRSDGARVSVGRNHGSYKKNETQNQCWKGSEKSNTKAPYIQLSRGRSSVMVHKKKNAENITKFSSYTVASFFLNSALVPSLKQFPH